MWKLFDIDGNDCWSKAEFDQMCVSPCDLTFIDVSTAAAKDSKCGSDNSEISPDDFAVKAEDLQAFRKPLERPMTQMAGECGCACAYTSVMYVCLEYIYRLCMHVCTYIYI